MPAASRRRRSSTTAGSIIVARPRQEQALEIIGQKGKGSLEYAASLEALASYRSAMEDDRRTRELLQDAIAIRKARSARARRRSPLT